MASIAAILATGASESSAHAWCRSTTCRGTEKKPCPTDDNGCPKTGKKLFWTTSCVGFSIQKDGTQLLGFEQAETAIRQSFDAWTEVKCEDGSSSMSFTFQKLVECHKSRYQPEGTNVNVILFQDNDWIYRGIDGTLAKTSVTYDDATGEIYDADIEVNAANNALTTTDDANKTKYDLQAILTHEVGHFIGIAHSLDESAVMFASYTPGTSFGRKLTDDDKEAACGAYPPDRKAECQPNPRGGFDETCAEEEEGCSVSPRRAMIAQRQSPPIEGEEPGRSSSQGVETVGLFLGVALLLRVRQTRKK